MCFLIEGDDLLKKNDTIWDKFSTDNKKEFDNEPIYNKKFLEIKIKSDDDEAADFHDKETPKVGSNQTCLAVIAINSALKKEENYHLQVVSKEFK